MDPGDGDMNEMAPDVATPRPRFRLTALDWLALLALSALGGYGYNVAIAKDREELIAMAIGTALAIAAISWFIGRFQWASGGRKEGGGRVAFRIALVVIAGFAWIKGAEKLAQRDAGHASATQQRTLVAPGAIG